MKLATLVLLFTALVVIAVAQKTTKKSESGNNFGEWKKKYGKSYKAGKTEKQAEANFKANAAKIAKHNSNPKKTYKAGINANADMTDAEIKKYRKGFKPAAKAASKALKSSKNSFKGFKANDSGKYKARALPESLDYTE